jgi:spermidine/putrescine-binding protein
MGISFEYRGNTNKAKGAPIDLVFPKEGLGWDLEAFAIHKGTKKLDAAKKLADWASSKDAMMLYGKNFAITAQPGVARRWPMCPRTTSRAWSRWTSPGPPTTASASWPSGPSAITPKQKRSDPPPEKPDPPSRGQRLWPGKAGSAAFACMHSVLGETGGELPVARVTPRMNNDTF